MDLVIPQRSLWLCNLDTEGRKNSCKSKCHRCNLPDEERGEIKKHFFVVISKKNNQKFVTALPISSKHYQIKENAGVSINSDDIDSLPTTKKEFVPTKLTLALAKKPCRIPVDQLIAGEEKGILKKQKYEDVIYEIKGCINPK